MNEIDQADVFNQGIYEVVKIDRMSEASPTTALAPGSSIRTGPSHCHSPGKAMLPKLTLKSFDRETTVVRFLGLL